MLGVLTFPVYYQIIAAVNSTLQIAIAQDEIRRNT
jgi:hypothetical protein